MIEKTKRVGVIFALLAGMFCSMGAGWLDRESIPVDQKGVANGVATLDETVKIPISQLPTGAVNNAENGTVTGQLIYWDNTAGEWKHTEVTEMFWDDVNKRLGIKVANPNTVLHLKDSTGITIGDGTDTDQYLITVDVTGTPQFWWDEGDNSFRINKSVMLDHSGEGAVLLSLSSTNKGFLPPRMTSAQRDAITLPPEGLMLYDMTNSKPDYFDGTVWKAFVSTDVSTFTVGSIPFATGAHHISDDPDNIVWDNTNKRLGIGTDTPLYRVQIQDSVGAATVGLLIKNTNNASNLAFAQVTLESGGASGSDPRVRFAVNGVAAADWTIGVDNSDSDKFKISKSNKLETSTRMLIDTTGKVGINIDDPLTRLHMKGGQLVLGNGSYAFALTKVNSQGVAWSEETTLPSIILHGKAGDRPEISFYRGSDVAPEFSIREHTTIDGGAEIYSGDGDSAPTMTMAFYDGKVGIGTNTPTDPLHVVGNARIVGDITHIGGTSMTGDLTSDGTVSGANVETSGKIYHTSIVTFTDADTTPTVGTHNIFKEENIDATSITAFDNGVTSQIITIIFTTGNTTIVDGASLHLVGGANFVGTADDTLQLVRDASAWFEVSRSVN